MSQDAGTQLDTCRVVRFQLNSDKVGKTLFHTSKSMYAEPQEKPCDARARSQARQIQWTLSAQNAPAKPINDTYHRVKGIE